MRATKKILVGGIVLAQQLLSGVAAKRTNPDKRTRSVDPVEQNNGAPLDENRRKMAHHNGWYEDQHHADHYQQEEYDYDDYYYYDDYYGMGSKRSKKYSRSSRSSKRGKGGHYDDDWVYPEDDIVVDDDQFPVIPLPRPTITVAGRAFSTGAVVVVPVNPAAPNSTDLGTVYTFGQWANNYQDISSDLVPMFIDGVEALFWIELDGYCTRIGTGVAPHGYCHFSYSVADPISSELLGTFAAQGYVLNPIGSLAVTGGTGILTGITGLVELQPAILDDTMQPPFVDSAPPGADSLDEIQGYIHNIELLLLQEFALV